MPTHTQSVDRARSRGQAVTGSQTTVTQVAMTRNISYVAVLPVQIPKSGITSVDLTTNAFVRPPVDSLNDASEGIIFVEKTSNVRHQELCHTIVVKTVSRARRRGPTRKDRRGLPNKKILPVASLSWQSSNTRRAFVTAGGEEWKRSVAVFGEREVGDQVGLSARTTGG